MAGIRNIQEVMALVELIAVEICKEAKHGGFQVKDLIAFLQHPDFDKTLQDALDGLEQLPDEGTDIGLFEAIQLAKDTQRIVTSIVAAYKKTAA